MRPVSLYSSRRWNNVFFAFFFIFFFILTFNDFSYSGSTKNITIQNCPVKDSKPLTEENLRKELDLNHVICPDQVYAQIMIESGNLSSFLTKRTNNLLGMRFPYRRETAAVGIFLPSSNLIIKGTQSELKKYSKQNNYAVFTTWEDCIRDYKYWQEQSFNLTEIYLEFLGNHYAEDSLYVKKIKRIAS